MGNRFIIILAICAILFVGLFIFNKKDSGNGNNQAVEATSHTQGTGSVTLVEYGDFECPGCARFYPVLNQVKEKYGDQITFQYRHFPLLSIHPNAMIAHRAAEAAAKQGKFWEMHDLLFETQMQWSAQAGVSQNNASSIMETYATQLNLDIDKFNADRLSGDINDLIQADIKVGQDLRISGTPSFVLNGTKLDDARDTLEYFSEKIDAELAKNSQE